MHTGRWLLAVMVLFLCIGCQRQESASGPEDGVASKKPRIKLKAADDHPLEYPTTQALVFMKNYLEEQTDGRITVTMYPGAQLGAEKETIEQTQFGAIDINRVNVNPVAQISKKLGVLALPYLFRDTEHMRLVCDGPIGDELLEDLENYGLIGLAFLDSGARSFYNTKRPIQEPKDLEGLRIRVQKSEIMIDTVKALGGSPSTMAFEEVYTSLQTGVIDGAENNWPSYYDTGHYELARFYSLDEHSRVPEVILFSKKTWDKLTAEDRELIREAAKKSVPFMRKLWDSSVQKAREKVLQAGIEVNDVSDKSAFYQAVQPVYQKHVQDGEIKDLVDRIRSVE